VRLIAFTLLLSSCAGTLPSTTQVRHVSQVTLDAAVEICLLAHGVNAKINTGEALDSTRARIDAVCEGALQELQDMSDVAASKAVEDLREILGSLLQ
jgi:hypothetical protein